MKIILTLTTLRVVDETFESFKSVLWNMLA